MPMIKRTSSACRRVSVFRKMCDKCVRAVARVMPEAELLIAARLVTTKMQVEVAVDDFGSRDDPTHLARTIVQLIGGAIVVGVNTDKSIKRLKGEKRPIINEPDRLGVLEDLESIDYLVSFDDDTPLRLIEQILPDVLVKGADYAKTEVVGWEIVEKHGGRVALAPLIDGRSTSAVIQRILDAHGSDR